MSKRQKKIPLGWKEVKLGDFGKFKNGVNKSKNDFGHGTPFVNLMDIFGKQIVKSNEQLGLVNVSSTEIENYNLKVGDVLFVRSSVKSSGVGLTVLLDRNLKNTVYSGFIIRYRDNKKYLVHKYKKYCFSSSKFRYDLKSKSSISANTNINQEALSSLKLLIPSMLEQKRNIIILETWDEYLIKLTEKIETKKKIKKGLMQKLLTGKERLKMFNGKWKKINLGEVCNIRTGNKDNKDKVDNGEFPFFVRSPQVEKINSHSHDGEAILVPGEGNIGKIFHYINGKFDFHQRVYKISNFSNKVRGKYIYYYFTLNFERQAMRHSVKAAVDSLRLPTFLNFKIDLPNVFEQAAIVEVLSSADEEIEVLSKQKEKIEAQKKYLLNNLIAGKIRLPEFRN